MSNTHDGKGRVEFLVPPKRTIPNPLAVKKQTFSRSEQQALRSAPSLVVDSVRLPRTAATWGITGPELNRLGNAVRFIDPRRRSNARRSLERKPYRLRGYSSPAGGKAPSGGR